MTDRPDSLPGTPDSGEPLGTTRRHPEPDVLGEVLRALRIEGTLLLREVYRPPFRVAVPPAGDIEELLQVPPGASAVAFHLAERGSFELRRGSETLAVEPGDMVLAVGGEPHELARGQAPRALGFSELLAGAANPPDGAVDDARIDPVSITCGALVFSEARFNPLFSALPGLVRIRPETGEATARLTPLLALLRAELARGAAGVDYVVERLFELLCAEGLRAHAAAHTSDVGWFRGLADPAAGQALRAFHAAPGDRWNVARLASTAHLSPSRFAARFTEATGIAPMAYVARWRMSLAMGALARTDRHVSELAFELGYESVAAFSRAFTKHVGTSPSGYRRGARGSSS